MELPRRKKNRLEGYDYSRPNAYFITICTKDRKNLFWTNAVPNSGGAELIELSVYGEIVHRTICRIPECYPTVSVAHFVIMPNHVHLLLEIAGTEDGRPLAAPTISTVINQMKGAVARKAGNPVWQKGFYDHIVRGKDDYLEIWNYIESNPCRWQEDEFYAL